MTITLNSFSWFSIGKCQECKKTKQQLRQFKDKQMCNQCWIPFWLKSLQNINNQRPDQQLQIKKNLTICGYKETEKNE